MSGTDNDKTAEAVETSSPAIKFKRYRKIRGGHRSFARRIMHTVYTALGGTDIFSSGEYENLEGCRISLVEKKAIIDSYNDKILELMNDEEEIITDIVEASEFSDEINRTVLKIKLSLEVPAANPASQNVISSVVDTRPVPVSSKIKLPKLTLPRFGGEHKKWASFWDSFQAAVGQKDVNSAFDLCKLVKLKLNQGGFNMRKWCSNSSELMTMLRESPVFPKVEQNINSLELKIAEDERGYSEFVQNVNHSNSVLGQKWDNKFDIFQFDFDKILSCVSTDLVTKRTVLSITAKFFDHLGLISPVVLLFKLCLQTLCNNDLS
ncbi:hypothetical protein LOTGIDRAFT_174191 [Lottia gigantea]|uniref:Uncharacterized protein n=1 Tax=Lottia gigantea TaxID=225164 RepID=V4AUB6_LOTGI|nr:hypothetical protein LOTGIDRAFT_174191 [Lottia gigantea]ESO98545.1 hypothetical protein LOTGIDRAFT_174191 [Lottia gigantea]